MNLGYIFRVKSGAERAFKNLGKVAIEAYEFKTKLI